MTSEAIFSSEPDKWRLRYPVAGALLGVANAFGFRVMDFWSVEAAVYLRAYADLFALPALMLATFLALLICKVSARFPAPSSVE